MASYLPEYLKSKNRQLIFDLFAKKKQMARADVVRETGISFPTASKAIDFLISRNILVEIEKSIPQPQESIVPGRKSRPLQFNPLAYCAISIELDGKFASIGLIDLSGGTIGKTHIPLNNITDKKQISVLTKETLKTIETSPSPVLGVGIGLPLSVNPETQELTSFDIMKTSEPVPFKKIFTDFTKEICLPIYLENDVNLACKGEMFLRSLNNQNSDIAFLTLHNGVGMGIMINGKLWQGSKFQAGEIGAILIKEIDPADPKNSRQNTLENCINIEAINKKFGIKLENKPTLTEEQKNQIINFMLPHISTAIYNVICMLDLNHIVISGLIPQLMGESFYQSLKNILKDLLIQRGIQVEISPPQSNYSTLIGAASMVFDNTILNELQG